MRILAPIAFLGLAAVSHAADFYNDFSSTVNNGSNGWVLGYTDSNGANFKAFDTYTAVGTDGISRWYDQNNVDLLVPAAFKNTAGSTVHGIANGEAALHGGRQGEIAVARYIVPANGFYSISALFGAGDSTAQYGNVNVSVQHNGASLFSVGNTGVDQSYTGSFSALANDTIDFRVGIGNDTFYNDSTPLRASVQAVPEPTSMAALGLGALGILKRRRKA